MKCISKRFFFVVVVPLFTLYCVGMELAWKLFWITVQMFMVSKQQASLGKEVLRLSEVFAFCKERRQKLLW